MTATFVATLASGELEVTVSASAAPSWRLRVGDEQVEIDAVRLPSGEWSVLCEGRSHVVDLERGVDGRISALVDGEVVELVLEDARTRRFAKMVNRAGGSAAKGETLRAPIAGKVVKLAVAVGDEVAAGDPVVVLEAMKMENELCASRGGKVASIHVTAGDPVDTNQVLVKLS